MHAAHPSVQVWHKLGAAVAVEKVTVLGDMTVNPVPGQVAGSHLWEETDPTRGMIVPATTEHVSQVSPSLQAVHPGRQARQVSVLASMNDCL